MQKQSYKKLLSTLIASLLILSVLPMAISPVSAAVTIYLSEVSGNVGDEVFVYGAIDTTGGGVDIYWQNLGNRIAGDYVNSTNQYNVSITIPEDIHDIYLVIAVDNTTKVQDTKTFTIQPKITLNPKVGLAGDEVTVEGTGFGEEIEVDVVFAGPYGTDTVVEDEETSELGSFSATFDVPDFDYGDYTATATDDDGNSDDAAFEIGAAISLDPEEGPSGTVVTITGRGFTKTAGKDVTVTLGGITASQVEDIETKSNGEFEGEFIVPTIITSTTIEVPDTYDVVATDEVGVSGKLDFEVTGNSSITLTPETGAPGSAVTIEGMNFTALEGVEVTVKFGAVEVESLTTNVTGGFEGAVTAPNLVEPFTVNCSDEYGVWAIATFRTAVTGLYPDPTYGPVGEEVTLTAYGLTGDDANVTLGDIPVIRGTNNVADLLAGTSTFRVPTMPAGVYTLSVKDDDDFSASTDFEVTATTTLALDPSVAPIAYNVTLTGENFAPESTVSLVLYNSTYDLDMENVTSGSTTITTDEDGVFEFEWNVSALAGDILDIGSYWINATDDHDVYPDSAKLINITVVPFEVVEATLIVYTGTDEYMRGQYAQFLAKTSFKTTVAIELTDPTDFVHAIEIETTTKVGTLYLGTATVPIANDATLGAWTWIAEAFDKNATGSFDVVEEITVGTIEDRVKDLEKTIGTLTELIDTLSEATEDLGTTTAADIDALSDAVDTLSGAVETLKTEIAGVKTGVSTASSAAAAAEAAASAAQAAASAAQAAIAGLSTPVSEAKTAASAAQTAAEDAQSAVAGLSGDVSAASSAASEAKTAAQAAQGAVAGLNSLIYGVLIIALIAAIAGILATIQIYTKVVK